MSTVGGASLAALSDRLVHLREERATSAVSGLAALVEAYETRPRRLGRWRRRPTADPRCASRRLRRGRGRRNATCAPSRHRARRGTPAGTDSAGRALAAGGRTHTEVVLLATADRAAAPVTRAATPPPTLQQLADWAARVPAHAAQAQELVGIARSFGYDTGKLSTSEIGAAFSAQVEHSRAVVQAFKKQADVEPVGFLHLERISFSPDGIERGELCLLAASRARRGGEPRAQGVGDHDRGVRAHHHRVAWRSSAKRVSRRRRSSPSRPTCRPSTRWA